MVDCFDARDAVEEDVASPTVVEIRRKRKGRRGDSVAAKKSEEAAIQQQLYDLGLAVRPEIREPKPVTTF